MSSKVAVNITDEIRKSFTNGDLMRSTARQKQDFKLKKFQGKGAFGSATLCAGTVFGVSGLKD